MQVHAKSKAAMIFSRLLKRPRQAIIKIVRAILAREHGRRQRGGRGMRSCRTKDSSSSSPTPFRTFTHFLPPPGETASALALLLLLPEAINDVSEPAGRGLSVPAPANNANCSLKKSQSVATLTEPQAKIVVM